MNNNTYHVAHGGTELGVFDKEDIIAKLNSGDIPVDALIWQEGMANWAPVSTLMPSTLSPAYTGKWNVIEAMKTVYWYRYADFSGRASRAEFWYSVIGIIGLMSLFCLLMVVLPACGGDSGVGWILFGGMGLILLAFSIYAIVPGISLMVRRLHDINLSGWFYLLSLVPYVGGIILLVFALIGSKGPNQWGVGPEGPGPRK